MKPLFKRLNIKAVVFAAALVLGVKLVWFMVSIAFLAYEDLDYIPDGKAKPLHYTVSFASGMKKKNLRPAKKAATLQSMKNYQLLSVYHSGSEDIVTVQRGSKTTVLSRGEAIDGFKLIRAGVNYAVFEKDGKEYRLVLKDTKESDLQDFMSGEPKSLGNKSDENTTVENGEIVEVDKNHRIIDRTLLERYTSNLKDVYKNIGLNEVRKNGAIEGFRITFIRKGSPFEKLGLRRGDLLLEINGEKLTSYKAAFEAYRNIKDTTEATITLKRGNETMELTYEIN